MPARGVRIPLAPPTAALEKDAFTGYDLKKDPIKLHIPTAIISCVASTIFPCAKRFTKNN